MKSPDYQAVINFNKSSLILALKIRKASIILCCVISFLSIVTFLRLVYWDLIFTSIASLVVGYFLFRNYRYWRQVLNNSTKI